MQVPANTKTNFITCAGHKFTVSAKELPFGNNFKQISSKIVQYNGVDEIFAFVKCTRNSNEPGRIYTVSYSFAGKMEGCNTWN